MGWPWIRELLGITEVQHAGVAKPTRGKLNFASGAVVTDNPVTGATDVTIGSGIDPTAGALFRIHQDLPSTVAHFRLQDTTAASDVLLDSGPSGFHITHDSSGNPFPGVVTYPNYIIVKVGGISFVRMPSVDHHTAGTLALTGAMSAVMLVNGALAGGVGPYGFFGCAGNNSMYQLTIESNGNLLYWHEHGAGLNDEFRVRYGIPTGVFHVAFTRTSGGLIKLFMNGKLLGSTTLTMPDTPANSQFRFVNGGGAGPTTMAGHYASLRIDNVALSDQQIRDDYNWTLGRLYGYAL